LIRLCLIALLLAATGWRAAAEALLIRNATVLTVTKGTIQNGSVLVENGKITAVGQNLSAPAGAVVVDAGGKFLMPGLIDCHSHTAIEGGVNEGTVSDSSMVNIEDVLDPMDINIYRALAGGLTVSNVLHGSAAQRLYERHGFTVVTENPVDIFMLRSPGLRAPKSQSRTKKRRLLHLNQWVGRKSRVQARARLVKSPARKH